MKLILKPLDDSADQVLVCDHHGTACGALHMDTFLETPDRGPIYDELYRGRTVEIEVQPVIVEECQP